jgi:hypothetical protein
MGDSRNDRSCAFNFSIPSMTIWKISNVGGRESEVRLKPHYAWQYFHTMPDRRPLAPDGTNTDISRY